VTRPAWCSGRAHQQVAYRRDAHEQVVIAACSTAASRQPQGESPFWRPAKAQPNGPALLDEKASTPEPPSQVTVAVTLHHKLNL
jgi:hypothetical protein